jgi:hypothetical protein
MEMHPNKALRWKDEYTVTIKYSTDTQASTSSASGENVDLLKRFPTKNTSISLADEWIAHPLDR